MQYTDLPEDRYKQSHITKPITRERMADFALARCFLPWGEGQGSTNKQRTGCKVCGSGLEKGSGKRITYPRKPGYWGTAFLCPECFDVTEQARDRIREVGF